MKIRQQAARPCDKKGCDNTRFSFSCECLKECDQLHGFLKPDSTGTINHKNNTETLFNGCLELENFLVEESLVRYETRELGCYEVLFDGVECLQNFNSELFNEDDLDGEDQLSPAGIASFYLNSIENKVTDETDNEKQHPWRFTDESLISFLPSSLGYTQPITNTFATVAPNNLYDSFFLSLYAQGVFDKESDDLQNLATCLLHEIDTEVEIKKIWPRYSKLRYNKLKKVIWSKVTKKMPWWAKRFNKIWNILSDPQIDALTLEWFHDSDIKPSQLDNANQLGISIAAYQERLHWAYKKIEDLYPEFKRIKRRKTESLLKKRSPAPLYLIDINGEKIEIPTTAKREKKLTARQIIQIRKRAREVTKDKFVLMEDDEK